MKSLLVSHSPPSSDSVPFASHGIPSSPIPLSPSTISMQPPSTASSSRASLILISPITLSPLPSPPPPPPKFRNLPSLEDQRFSVVISGFGYDHVTHSYKMVVVLYIKNHEFDSRVHTLRSDSWRRIQHFPLSSTACCHGRFVSGMLNCHFTDVLIMKDYGIAESWTKLLCVPDLIYYPEFLGFDFNVPRATRAICISDKNDEILLELWLDMEQKFIVYNFSDDSFRPAGIEKFGGRVTSEVYVESLISPCLL
ncbi:hypothetical protein HN873_028164 [Arachis hypogaea]